MGSKQPQQPPDDGYDPTKPRPVTPPPPKPQGVGQKIWLASFDGVLMDGWALVRADNARQARRRVAAEAASVGLTVAPTAEAIHMKPVCVAVGTPTTMWTDGDCYIFNNGDY